MSKRDKQRMRMVFEAWREHTVESHASRFRKGLALEQRGMPVLWNTSGSSTQELPLLHDPCCCSLLHSWVHSGLGCMAQSGQLGSTVD